MLNLKAVALSYAMLAARVKPQAGEPEAIPYPIFDTQTYPAAGSGDLNFFNAASVDRTRSNMDVPGQLQAGTWLVVERVYVDFLNTPTVTAADTQAGAANDIAQILKKARATLTFKYGSKSIADIPLTFFGRSGGVEAVLGGNNTAPHLVQVGNMGDNGGYPILGNIIIPPGVSFGATIKFAANNVAISADTDIRVSLFGMLHRPVA